MISLIIPATTTNQNYTNNIITNIKSLYPDRKEVEIMIEVNDHVTLGTNYNNAVAKASGEKIILLHNDMVLSKGFIELMDRHIQKNRITTYTRVEPPIYPDIYPGKVIQDCGADLETFNENQFNKIRLEESLVGGGSQLFFGCMKEDYMGIDGHTFQKFCEDDDLHHRYRLRGFEHKVSSAHVYHFVSKTSRVGNFHLIEYNSNRNYIRKWGSRGCLHKYNIAFIVKNANYQIVEALEPWCDRIYIDDAMGVIKSHYFEKEQINTKYDLTKRVLEIEYNHPIGENDIIVKFDTRQFTNESFNIIQNLSEIITQSGEIGSYELDCFTITINSMQTYEKDLIICNTSY